MAKKAKTAARKKPAAKKRTNYKSLYAQAINELTLDKQRFARFDLALAKNQSVFDQERQRLADEINRLRSENAGFLGQVVDVAVILDELEQRIATIRDAITSLPGYNRPPMTGVTRKWSAI